MTAASRIRAGDDRDRLHWLLDHLPASRPGRPVSVLDLGCAEGELSFLLAERGDKVTGVDRDPRLVAEARRHAGRLSADIAARVEFEVGDGHALDGVPDESFDAAVAGEILDRVGDPVQVLEALHRTLRPAATLVFTVPYGVNEAVLRLARAVGDHAEDPGDTGEDEAERRRVFYHGSLRHLVEPLFEIRELTVLRHHLAGVAVRRDEPRGTPGFALSRAETAFLQRERHLHGEIAELRALCAELSEREATLTRAGQELLGRNAQLRAEATRLLQRMRHLEGRLAEYRELIARLRRSRAWRLITAYRRVRYSSVREAPPAAQHPVALAAPPSARRALPGRTEP